MSYSGFAYALPWSSSIPINNFSITEMPSEVDMFDYWNSELGYEFEQMAAYEEAGLIEALPESALTAASNALRNMTHLQSSISYGDMAVVEMDAWGLPLAATEAGIAETTAALEIAVAETAAVGVSTGIGAELATMMAVAPLVAAAVVAVAGIGYLIYELSNSGENSKVQKDVSGPNLAAKVSGKYALTLPTYGEEEYFLPVTAKDFFVYPFKCFE
jgi:hypothetical protein